MKVYRGQSIFTVNVLDLLKIKTVDFVLQDRDFIMVPRNNQRVTIFGVVRRPGSYLIPDGGTLSVAQALELAGGFASGSNIEQARLLRSLPVQTSEFVRPEQRLQNGDVLYVRLTTSPAEPPRGGAKFQFLSFNLASR